MALAANTKNLTILMRAQAEDLESEGWKTAAEIMREAADRLDELTKNDTDRI